MGICRTCKELKENVCFAFKDKARNKRSTQCKDCFNTWRKEWYQKNKQYYIRKAMESKARRRTRNKACITKYLLEHPCIDCGEADPVALDFHHVLSKRYGISDLVQQSKQWKLIEDEIKRCVVVCATCHRKRHKKGS